jgi:hypothetical protein
MHLRDKLKALTNTQKSGIVVAGVITVAIVAFVRYRIHVPDEPSDETETPSATQPAHPSSSQVKVR